MSGDIFARGDDTGTADVTVIADHTVRRAFRSIGLREVVIHITGRQEPKARDGEASQWAAWNPLDDDDLTGGCGPDVRHSNGRAPRGLAPMEGETRAAEVAKLILECQMLDQAGVPNGDKAVGIWLHYNWTADLIDRYGAHHDPNAIRRWRAVGRRTA